MDEEIISSQNHFDRLPDDLLRLILNRVHHAKSLCACLAVSTRFNSIALHSTFVSLSIDRIHFDDDDDDDDDDVIPSTASSVKHNHLLLPSLIRFFISTPLRFLSNLLTSRFPSSSTAVFYSPTEALKSFSRIEILKIQLPSHGELQLDRASNPALKWKASFGSELKTCVIVAGTSIDQFKKVNDDEERERRDSVFNSVMKDELDTTDRGAEPPLVISNEDLKMRVVWTISCLIAASARHHLLKRIVTQHPMLKAIEMVDEHRQGTLTMEEADISQMRKSICISDSDSNPDDEISCSISNDRTRIPALRMKMWHAAELELPECNKVMRGATFVLIGAAEGGGGDEVDGGVEGMFNGGDDDDDDDERMYGEVAREIRKKMKQSYSLEMESF